MKIYIMLDCVNVPLMSVFNFLALARPKFQPVDCIYKSLKHNKNIHNKTIVDISFYNKLRF